MNKQEALNRLSALESEATKLRAILKAPEQTATLLERIVPESGQEYWYPTALSGQVSYGYANAENKIFYDLAFTTGKQALEYRAALATLLDLRRQPGSENPKNGVWQWAILLNEDNSGVFTDDLIGAHTKSSLISPCFHSEEHAEAAINAVGHDRIIHMFKTLHGL